MADYQHPFQAAQSRDKKIIQTSVVGIAANVFLAAFKAVIGTLSRSIAITMDAVNNISDAASSVITIVGTKLAGKQADKKHPFGYGRIEYLSAMIISVLVLYAGVTALVESVKKIITPDTPDYSAVTLIIIAVAVVVKIALGLYVKGIGGKVNSDSLINSGKDALLDSVISASTLVAAGVYLIFHISLEAYLGAVIALVIIKSGIEMLRETLSKILGERADAELAKAIKATIVAHPEIAGAYDLVLHNYGPETYHGSVHIEVPDTLAAEELDRLIRKVTEEVYAQHKVILTAVGIYSVNTKDPAAAKAREDVKSLVCRHDYILQMHGFSVDFQEKTMRFDLVVSFDAPNRQAAFGAAYEAVRQAFPDFTIQAIMDTDFSE